jgi:hypothetical protein
MLASWWAFVSLERDSGQYVNTVLGLGKEQLPKNALGRERKAGEGRSQGWRQQLGAQLFLLFSSGKLASSWGHIAIEVEESSKCRRVGV